MKEIKVTITKERKECFIRKGKTQAYRRRLFPSPARSNESLMLELSKAWEPRDRSGAWNLIQAQDPSVVFLAETWLKKARLEEIRACYRFGGMIEVSREGRGGKLVLFWKKDCDISVDTFSPNHIDAIVNKGKDEEWRSTGFYGKPDTRIIMCLRQSFEG